MTDPLYTQPEPVILLVALLGLFLMAELGHQRGRRMRPENTERLRHQVAGIMGGLLGLLALLLGFSFSMALERFETRKRLVVEEANAIGTAMLRSEFLPAADRPQAMNDFRRYVGIRLELGRRPNLIDHVSTELNRESEEIQRRLWRMASTATQADPHSVAAGLYAEAMNGMIDIKSANDAALANRVPQSVLILLYGVSMLSMGIVGYANGLAGTRTLVATMILVLLLAVVILTIVDLDRPRRGFIQVSQKSLADLKDSLDAEGGTSP